ncbi:ribulose 1,5-bisphosphate carboxylase [Roseospira marina]|uniref:Ribulose 1,5-bisphosphate carboxylase n=1 Tax=Roseospira marina TaxID=140057 RepID=A0A5M6I9F0_9PROT|nr:RuBisCO large subunit C-terminal-like domain-containing protein [Roseospira marina]KAA5604914.1 ribulose 1,5-bisphosphate carboxylase [Roseospira marina]MBB4315255.1 ribulose-bisphosphate carboxylase large chain [Roseospira marina]MBB5088255.1 ribulose-bisphosphate carboxylase large chain [Roseospira marina]
MTRRIVCTYHVTADADTIEARAKGIAVEQSVEMPLAAITDQRVMDEIVGKVQDIAELAPGLYAVTIGLATETVGDDAGQLINMIYGNTSIQPDTVLADAAFPPEILETFGGPRQGIAGLRARVNAPDRALTCSALKPQGLPVPGLADLAYRFALGGLDFIKDDHGLANQHYAPYVERVPAVAAAVRKAREETGGQTRYIPSLTGGLDQLREQARIARDEGLDCLMIQPMICGFPAMQTLVRENPDMAFFTHPTMTGAARIDPRFLHGTLFRLLGGDAVVYTNHGGRFAFTREVCMELGQRATRSWNGLKPALPVPAGGMTLDRVPEMIECYGRDVMLLIGGGLLLAKENLVEETRTFQDHVAALSAAAPASVAAVAE